MFLNILLFCLGITFGSFVGAYTWRYPRGISIKKGRSFCPHCKEKINWYDNIPLLSFASLGGRCRHCHKKISVRYPLIELGAGLGFLLIGNFINTNFVELIFNLIVFLLLYAIFVTDLEHQLIPDEAVFLAILLTVIKLLYSDNPQILAGILSGLGAAVFLLLIHILTKGRGMGLGDVKFAVFVGMFLGPAKTIPWLFLAFLTGGIVGIILILVRQAKLKDSIAFGPFLIVSIYLTQFLWPYLDHYLRYGYLK